MAAAVSVIDRRPSSHGSPSLLSPLHFNHQEKTTRLQRKRHRYNYKNYNFVPSTIFDLVIIIVVTVNIVLVGVPLLLLLLLVVSSNHNHNHNKIVLLSPPAVVSKSTSKAATTPATMMMLVEAFRFRSPSITRSSLPSRRLRRQISSLLSPLSLSSSSSSSLSSKTVSTMVNPSKLLKGNNTITSSLSSYSSPSVSSLSSSSSTTTAQTTTTNIPSTVSIEEITIPLMDGITIAGQRYRYKNNNNNNTSDEKDDRTQSGRPKQTILALHGWLDNCRSFYYLAPQLVDRLGGTAEIVAIDLPGHGWSSHKSLDGPPMVLSEALFYVKETIDKLGWNNNNNNNNSPSTTASKPTTTTTTTNSDNGDDRSNSDDVDRDPDVSSSSSTKLTLLGHSMGGGISMAYSAVYPDQVDKLVLIDVYGPLPGQVDKTCSLMKSHIESRQHGPKPHRAYPSIEKAIQARRITASKAPGKQSLSLEAATEMVRRATEPIQTTSSPGEENNSKNYNEGDSSGGGQVHFRHDTRLVWPSIQYLMPEQVDELTKSVECPTCIIAGDSGWPFKQERIDKALSLLDPVLEHHVIEGSHHLHADPGPRDEVLDIVHGFLVEEKRNYVV